MFSMAMWMAALVAPVQIFVGDLHGLNTLEHQPAKIMAMEGHFQSHPDGAPLILFGIPDDEARDGALSRSRSRKLGSLILKHDLERAAAPGSTRCRRRTGRRSAIVFWSFRIMVGLGFLMFALGLWSLSRGCAGRLYDWRWLHRFALVDGAGGLRRGDRRLGHHRGRPPALGDLRPAAHRATRSRRSPRRP